MKGMSAVAEALMAMGIIIVSVMFVLVAGNIVSFQTSQTTLTSQRNIPQDIGNLVETMRSMEGATNYTYSIAQPTYTLWVTDNSFVEVSTPQRSFNSSAFVSEDISIAGGSSIRNSGKICIVKNQDQFKLKAGACGE